MSGNDILSRIQILLDADTARFEQGMQDAQESSASSFKKIRESANTMGAWVVGASVTATSALLAMAAAQAEQAQQIELAAYKAQSSTTEIQKYGVAAKQLGIETDALADIYKDFNEKMGEFVTVGGGGMLDFFEQVALKTEGGADGAMKLAKKMAALSGPEAMGLYVKKMEEANLSQDQMSFLMESAASDATMLIPLYKNNAEQIKLWGDAAERTGVILDESGIKKAAEFRVQSELLQMQMSGMKTQLVQAVIPAFVDIADAFNTGDKKARAMADGGEVLANVLRGVAAIGIGVYTTVNLIANSLAGLTATSVAAIDVANREAEAANAKWYDKLPGVKLFKASVMVAADVKSPKGIVSDMADQNARIVEQSAGMLNKIFDQTVSEATAKMAGVYDSVNQAQSKTTQGQQDWLDKQNKVDEANKKAIQAQKEHDQLLKEQAQSRKDISYQYADRLKQIQSDLDTEIDRIEKAKFSRADQDGLVAAAIFRAQAERDLYIAEQQFEINTHRFTEEQKLAEEFKINQLKIKATADLHEDMKQASLVASTERYQQELAWMRLEKAQAENDAGSLLRTDLQNMEIKYAYERDQILLNSKLSEEEKKRRTALSLASEEFEKRQNLNDATSNWGGNFADLTGTGDQYRLEQERFSRYDESQALFDAQMALANSAAEREAIWQAHNDRMAMIDDDYQTKSTQQNLSFGEQIAGSFAGMFKSISGEQSAAYKAMFVAQKAFSISSALLSIKSGIAKAVDLPFPMNLAAMASVAATTATLVSDIQSVAGVFHGGTDYVPKESSYLLDKGERVLSPRQNTDLTRYLSNQRQSNSGANINITNNTPAKVSVRQESNGQIGITMDEVEQFVSNSLAQPNSRISKSVSQNTSAARRR